MLGSAEKVADTPVISIATSEAYSLDNSGNDKEFEAAFTETVMEDQSCDVTITSRASINLRGEIALIDALSVSGGSTIDIGTEETQTKHYSKSVTRTVDFRLK